VFVRSSDHVYLKMSLLFLSLFILCSRVAKAGNDDISSAQVTHSKRASGKTSCTNAPHLCVSEAGIHSSVHLQACSYQCVLPCVCVWITWASQASCLLFLSMLSKQTPVLTPPWLLHSTFKNSEPADLPSFGETLCIGSIKELLLLTL